MSELFYGAETEKALNSFGREQTPFKLIKAYAEVKKAAISAIQDYNKGYSQELYEELIKSCDQIISGDYKSSFVLPLFQGGAGTSLHMNTNEVIANVCRENYKRRYNEEVDPDIFEVINRYQSTNDTFPTAVTVALYRELLHLEETIIRLQEAFVSQELKWQNVLIAGRTEYQDALPITLGQVFGSFAGAVERDRWRFNKLKERIRNINLGGTALGTCFFAPRDYVFLAENKLREITNLPLSRSQNLPDETANMDKWSEMASGIKILSENILKFTNDLLIYTSSFLGELKHPDLQFGSTIMPAKTNPVILEYVKGVAIDSIHESLKVSEYASQGIMQLNSFLPFIYKSLATASENTVKAVNVFIDLFLEKFEVNEQVIRDRLFASPVLLNSLRPLLGYIKVKEVWQNIRDKKFSDMEEYISEISRHTDVSVEVLREKFQAGSLTTYSE